jgi:hypothetical protein
VSGKSKEATGTLNRPTTPLLIEDLLALLLRSDPKGEVRISTGNDWAKATGASYERTSGRILVW